MVSSKEKRTGGGSSPAEVVLCATDFPPCVTITGSIRSLPVFLRECSSPLLPHLKKVLERTFVVSRRNVLQIVLLSTLL
jgi:hypothetical protein